jgi:hypothetical protein
MIQRKKPTILGPREDGHNYYTWPQVLRIKAGVKTKMWNEDPIVKTGEWGMYSVHGKLALLPESFD